MNTRVPIPINLKTDFGCCSPQPIPQDCDYTLSVPDLVAVQRFTRPPLVQRECCSVEPVPEAQQYFIVETPTP